MQGYQVEQLQDMCQTAGMNVFTILPLKLNCNVYFHYHTVFARSEAVATIYFITQFCAASIREWLLIESGIY